MSDEEATNENERYDGDWCLVDLSDEVTEEATQVAHALGMDFYEFMCAALEETLALVRGDVELSRSLEKVQWRPLLK